MKVGGIVLNPTAESRLALFLHTPAHAALLAGPKGSGKTHIANAVAANLLNAPSLETHAYFRTITPTDGSIAIEQIRELISFFRLKVPGKAAVRRVAIIEDADTMGLEAQNALLKALEEPPTDSVLLLTSSQSERLLPTVRSRLQILQLIPPGTDALKEHFISQGFEAAAVAGAIVRGGDNIAETARLLRDPDSTAATTVELVKQALSGSRYDRLLMVDKLYKQREVAVDFTNTLATIAMVSLQSAASKGSATIDRWKTVLEAAHTAQDALSTSGNTKLVLTELMLAF